MHVEAARRSLGAGGPPCLRASYGWQASPAYHAKAVPPQREGAVSSVHSVEHVDAAADTHPWSWTRSKLNLGVIPARLGIALSPNDSRIRWRASSAGRGWSCHPATLPGHAISPCLVEQVNRSVWTRTGTSSQPTAALRRHATFTAPDRSFQAVDPAIGRARPPGGSRYQPRRSPPRSRRQSSGAVRSSCLQGPWYRRVRARATLR